MKTQLIFDVTDAGTLLASDNVGAWTRAGDDGARIGSQLHNSENWLNTTSILYDETGNPINNSNPLAVDLVSPVVVDVQLEGIYDAGTNPNPDNTGIIMHTRAASPSDVEQIQRTTAAVIGTVAAADLAKVHAIDVNAFAYAIDDVSGDAELLSKDSSSNGLNVHLAGSDITVAVSDAALANTAIVAKKNLLDTANTAEDLVTAPLANRKYLWILNHYNKFMWIGGPGVTAANGFPISGKVMMELRAGPAVDIEWVADDAGHDVRTLELS